MFHIPEKGAIPLTRVLGADSDLSILWTIVGNSFSDILQKRPCCFNLQRLESISRFALAGFMPSASWRRQCLPRVLSMRSHRSGLRPCSALAMTAFPFF
jgi:hypothetical protein